MNHFGAGYHATTLPHGPTPQGVFGYDVMPLFNLLLAGLLECNAQFIGKIPKQPMESYVRLMLRVLATEQKVPL